MKQSQKCAKSLKLHYSQTQYYTSSRSNLSLTRPHYYHLSCNLILTSCLTIPDVFTHFQLNHNYWHFPKSLSLVVPSKPYILTITCSFIVPLHRNWWYSVQISRKSSFPMPFSCYIFYPTSPSHLYLTHFLQEQLFIPIYILSHLPHKPLMCLLFTLIYTSFSHSIFLFINFHTSFIYSIILRFQHFFPM